jgi:hypothetical protein
MNARASNNPHLNTTWDVISFLSNAQGSRTEAV